MKTTKEMIEVMQAHADGKVVECIEMNLPLSKEYVSWDWSQFDYRIKPLEFPPLPEGLEWSNPSNKTPEEVGEDWRLLTTVECLLDWIEGAQFWRDDSNRWGWAINREGGCFASSFQSIRVPISTPFPEPPKKKVMVPLEKGDINILTDLFRWKDEPNHEMTLNAISGKCAWPGQASTGSSFERLQKEMEIKRPGQDWQPCEKEAP